MPDLVAPYVDPLGYATDNYQPYVDPMTGTTPEQSAAYLAQVGRLFNRNNWLADTRRAAAAVGNYLADVPSQAYNALDWAGTNVALPALQKQEELYNRDWSKEPLVGFDKGQFTGRIPALAEFTTPYVLGAAPAGSMSAGVRLPGGREGGYHGTPHTFPPTAENQLGVFKDEAMGSGQGSQVRGWGHYIGGVKDTGQSYRPPENITLSTGQGGNLYHVALPPKESALLDLEKNLGEQSPEVKAVIAKINADRFQREYPPDMNAEDFQSTLLSDPRVNDYRERMGYPDDRYGRAKAVSKYLNSLGIPGNRFYDQGSRYAQPVVHYGEKPIKQIEDVDTLFSKSLSKDPYHPPAIAVSSLFNHNGDMAETLNYLANAAAQRTAFPSSYPGNASIMTDVYRKAERWLQRNRDKFSVREPERTYNYVMFGPEHTDIVDVEK